MDELEKIDKDIRDINKVLYQLTEAQKNTTKNVDILTSDIKEMLKKSMNCQMVHNELQALEHRVTDLEASKTWGFRLVVGALMLGLVNILLEGAV